MIVEYQYAVNAYESFPDCCRIPHLHPSYIVIDALREAGRLPEFFLYEKEGNFYYHGYTKGLVQSTNLIDHESAYGYGGPVATTKDPDFLGKAWEAYDWTCRNSHTIAEFVRLHPILENDYFYKGNIKNNRETVWLDLSKNYTLAYKERAKRKVRALKADKVVVEWTKAQPFCQFFYKTYAHHMKRLNAENFYQFSQAYLSQLLLWNKAHLAIAFKNDNPLGAAIFLIDGYICDYHLGATTDEGHDQGVLNILFDAGAAYAQNQGCHVLHLGGGRTEILNDNLLFFKAGFSNNRATFSIGSMIWNPEFMNALRQEFIEKYGCNPTKVLFYR